MMFCLLEEVLCEAKAEAKKLKPKAGRDLLESNRRERLRRLLPLRTWSSLLRQHVLGLGAKSVKIQYTVMYVYILYSSFLWK